MKLRQAAALVLVGWYLMVPPDSRQGTRLIFRRNAPLTQWYKERDFESEAACKAALASFSKTIKAKLKVGYHNFHQAVEAERLLYGQCIASDDPRLKGN